MRRGARRSALDNRAGRGKSVITRVGSRPESYNLCGAAKTTDAHFPSQPEDFLSGWIDCRVPGHTTTAGTSAPRPQAGPVRNDGLANPPFGAIRLPFPSSHTRMEISELRSTRALSRATTPRGAGTQPGVVISFR